MSESIPIHKLWDDSFCNVTEDYNESSGKNRVYTWESNKSCLATNKDATTSPIELDGMVDNHNACNSSLPQKNHFKQKKRCDYKPHQRESYTASRFKTKESLSENLKFHQIFPSDKSPTPTVVRDNGSPQSWKEKCRIGQKKSSTKILRAMKSMPQGELRF
ncbi:unnamed protein product [Moneuplotes crassus]|uniref:Uncharacterized protein n=1 Tax=Euplotes crassus TaxID=5936 RepID=A0AAD1U166_EUPCR|nr:unnamed protein product [Moneuplotes crassus]